TLTHTHTRAHTHTHTQTHTHTHTHTLACVYARTPHPHTQQPAHTPHTHTHAGRVTLQGFAGTDVTSGPHHTPLDLLHLAHIDYHTITNSHPTPPRYFSSHYDRP